MISEKNCGLNRDTIKYIAMLTMLLNHLSTIFLDRGTFLGELFLDVGYFTAPVMCWFLAEGYQYTRSKKNYAVRLFLFALLSEIIKALPNGFPPLSTHTRQEADEVTVI